MKIWKVILPVAAILLFAGQAAAQSEADREREMEMREAEYAERLREAEQRMEEAARQVAELTSERLPQLAQLGSVMEFSKKPRLGVTIDGMDDSGPVNGVVIDAVTPGSAADDAGLRAGDVITGVSGKSLRAENSRDSYKTLVSIMRDVEEGDVIDVDYQRDGNVGSVKVSPRITEMHAFAWAPRDGHELHVQGVPGVARVPNIVRQFRMESGFPWAGSSWGSMELVELSEGLGKYFGTDSGLLVVSAPSSDNFELEDGDVIRSIDGREPTDVRHAMRILSSYKSGEKLALEIMRNKKKRTLDIEIPADHRGSLFAPAPVKPVRALKPAPAALPDVST